jgi:exodeoxyribonuclease VII small subunit
MATEFDFETALNELNEIVEKIESGECSLDESIKLFEQGIELSNTCTKMLNEAKEKVLKLSAKEEE